MAGTRWREKLSGTLRDFHRELRISVTPVVKPEKWVFIVGCYNSGTQLLMNLLGAHPAISSLPVEGQFLTDQLPRDYTLGLPRMWVMREDLFRLTEHDAGPDVTRLKKEWLMRLDRSRSIFVEKSPPNAARTRWLQHHFENAHFIGMVRNGYAVAEGIRRKAEPHHLKDGWPIEYAARQWNRSNEILVEDAEKLDRMLWVKYEDLTADVAAEVRRIARFLGLDGSATAAIDFDQAWSIHEREEPVRNMNQQSIERLSVDELEIVTREAGPMLEHFDYPVISSEASA